MRDQKESEPGPRAEPSSQDELRALKVQLEHAQKELEKFERMKPLASAAAAIVHDIRNSLGVISSTAQFVLNKLSPPERERQAWELVERNVDGIKSILKGYLGLARQTEGARELAQPNAIIERVRRFIDNQAKKQNVRVELDLAKDLPPLFVNVSSIESAVLNIALNAIEAMADGGLLRFATRLESAPGGNLGVVMEVEDNGPGIPSEILAKLFTPFVTTKEQGTGMGLYSAKAALTQNEGRIDCESRPGKTRVILKLPPAQEPPKPKP